MAKFGWAYIDCNSAESGSEGPNGSLQFSYDDTGRTTGSAYLTFFTASGVQSYLPNSLILSLYQSVDFGLPFAASKTL